MHFVVAAAGDAAVFYGKYAIQVFSPLSLFLTESQQHSTIIHVCECVNKFHFKYEQIIYDDRFPIVIEN